ncbi:hypothetical protein ATG71_2059 [Bacillus sp. es.034]|nr:hypothetical protein ATG71_2059 [Bacillus sp. es.034]
MRVLVLLFLIVTSSLVHVHRYRTVGQYGDFDEKNQKNQGCTNHQDLNKTTF